MGYHIRVLSTSPEPVPISTLKDVVADFKASLSIETGEEFAWQQLLLSHADGSEIALIERCLVDESSLATEELNEFREELADAKPRSGVDWVLNYFERVRCIYVCQLLNGTEHLNGWEIFSVTKNALWSFAPSIIQADDEGFSNEEGYHIVWQFGEDVKGTWWMGLLRDGQWAHFQMQLGNHKQRGAFFRGEIPAGVKVV